MLKKLKNKKGGVVVGFILVVGMATGLTARAYVKGYLKNPVPKEERNHAPQPVVGLR